MKDAETSDHVSLTALIGRLREGRFVIPDPAATRRTAQQPRMKASPTSSRSRSSLA
jgi:hypothetical protein